MCLGGETAYGLRFRKSGVIVTVQQLLATKGSQQLLQRKNSYCCTDKQAQFCRNIILSTYMKVF